MKQAHFKLSTVVLNGLSLALSSSLVIASPSLSMAVANPTAAQQPQQQVQPQPSVIRKILLQGVPMKSLERILDFLRDNGGQTFTVDGYSCQDKPFEDITPCSEDQRTPALRRVTLNPHRYAAVLDFSRPSTEKRLFVIDLENGGVTKFLATHGRGSGEGRYAYKFSNIKDSRQSSLGLFRVGEVYRGKYGESLRMYGLERSNDQAYVRDIVMHGANYASSSFPDVINEKTGKPIGRLGLSHGCPAVSPTDMRGLLPLLRDGALIDLYHPDLMEEALSGREVYTVPPEWPTDLPRPQARPVSVQ